MHTGEAQVMPAAEAAEVGGDWCDAFLQPGGATMLHRGSRQPRGPEPSPAQALDALIVRAARVPQQVPRRRRRRVPSESVVKVLIAIRPLLTGQWKYAPPGPSSGRAPHRHPADVAGPQRTGGGVPSTVAASAGSHAQVVQECRTTARAKRTEVACGSSAQRTSSQSRTNSPSARSQRAVGG
jgi:hypothetical protein